MVLPCSPLLVVKGREPAKLAICRTFSGLQAGEYLSRTINQTHLAAVGSYPVLSVSVANGA